MFFYPYGPYYNYGDWVRSTFGSLLNTFGPKRILHIRGADIDENFNIQYGKRDNVISSLAHSQVDRISVTKDGRRCAEIKGQATKRDQNSLRLRPRRILSIAQCPA